MHRLVTAALLLVSATRRCRPPPLARRAAPPRAPHDGHRRFGRPDSQAGGRPDRAARPQDAAAEAEQGPHVEKIYIVKPPVGRFHESLWEIAQNHLGNGLRYREIFDLNKDRPQPDGTRLTMASLIRPGWVLRMPRDAYGPGIEIVSHDAGRSGRRRRAGRCPPGSGPPRPADGTPGSASGLAQGSAAVPGAPAGAGRAGQRPAGRSRAGPRQPTPGRAEVTGTGRAGRPPCRARRRFGHAAARPRRPGHGPGAPGSG